MVNQMSAEFTPITQVVESYLATDSVQPRIPELTQLADQIAANRTPGTDGLDLEGITAVPVAAHQDGNHVWHTLQGHVDSLGTDFNPRTQVLLSLNAPEGAKRQPVDETLDAARTFAEEHPDFPMSFYQLRYSEGTPIGTVRGDLADSGLLWATRVSGLIAPDRPDLALIINDIDEHDRQEGYETAMLDTLQLPETLVARGLMDYEASGFDNIDKLIAWFNVVLRAEVSVCEANQAISVRDAYIPASGYDRTKRADESMTVAANAPSYKTMTKPVKTAENSLITSSNRHLLAAALQGTPPWKIDISLGVESLPHRSKEETTRTLEAGQDVSEADYAAWTLKWQQDILRYGGAVRYRRNGPDSLRKLAQDIEDARATLGGGVLAEGEADSIIADVIANTEWIHDPAKRIEE